MKKQEFVTVYGKAIIERDVLYIKSFDVPFSETAFAKIGYEVAFVVLFILQFFNGDGNRKYVGILLWGLLLLGHLPGLYDAIFKRSYAKRIPLEQIKSLKIKEDNVGLQTYVIMDLASGRYRKIAFRKLENQYQPFIETISQYLPQYQPA